MVLAVNLPKWMKCFYWETIRFDCSPSRERNNESTNVCEAGMTETGGRKWQDKAQQKETFWERIRPGRTGGIMRRWPILRSKQAGKVLLMSPWRHSLPERSLDWNEGTDFWLFEPISSQGKKPHSNLKHKVIPFSMFTKGASIIN
jgi:hypothetical protein